jgi:DNA-binding MurR/RpiR family transcriptional regulator
MLIDTISSRIEQMSPVNQKIAQYVLGHKEDVGFLSIAEVSESVAVSQASLVRFAKLLGFKGFNEFKKIIQDEIRQQLSPFEKTLTTDLGLKSEEDQLHRLTENEIANLEKTLNNLDIGKVMKIVEGIISARQLFVCGFGGSAFLAGKFIHSIETIMEKHTSLITGSISDYTRKIAQLKESDSVIVITLPRYSKEVLYVADLVNDAGAKLFVFTDSAQCPIYSKADEVIFCHNNTLILANSYTSILGLIQIIVDMVFLSRREEGLRAVQKAHGIETRGYEKFQYLKG